MWLRSVLLTQEPVVGERSATTDARTAALVTRSMMAQATRRRRRRRHILHHSRAVRRRHLHRGRHRDARTTALRLSPRRRSAIHRHHRPPSRRNRAWSISLNRLLRHHRRDRLTPFWHSALDA